MSLPSCDDVRKALDAILKSRSFARAEQLRRLVQYVVEATIDGRANTLKEMTIGIDAFDLSTDFDPKRDPVVRMAMRRLRDRLQRYYTYEGAADPVLISLEPGSYIPRFLPHRNEQEERLPIAVLPFGSLQEGRGQENCGVLLREALLTRLAENNTFRLIGNEAPQSFWASSDLGSIGRQLQVRFMVRGACFAGAETIRVCTELFCSQTDESVWSGNHEQDASREIWTVQNDIAVDLEKQALAADGRQQAPVAEAFSEAGVHRLMLQGRHYLLQNNSESTKKAGRCFAAVLEKHPESAKAWAALSLTYSLTRCTIWRPPIQRGRRPKRPQKRRSLSARWSPRATSPWASSLSSTDLSPWPRNNTFDGRSRRTRPISFYHSCMLWPALLL